jgi:sarcosine oxidase, subunit beta
VAGERFGTIVLGAGIAGCSLAYHLSRDSPTSEILVIDPRGIAGGATGRGAGVMTEQLWDPWDILLVRDSLDIYRGLATADDPSLFRPAGFLRWSHRPEHRARIEEASQRLRGWGVEATLVDAPRMSELLPEGQFGPDSVGLYSTADALVDPPSLTQKLADAAESAGTQFEVHQPIDSLARSEDQFQVSVGGLEFRSPRLVLATGAWTKLVSASLGHELPIVPYRCQAARLRPAEAARPDLPVAHDLDEDVYLRSLTDGSLLVGNGTELVEANPERYAREGDERFLTHIRSTLMTRFPRWAEAPVDRAWAGIVDATPDRRPLVGAIPNVPGAYVVAGFNGFGIMRAAGASRRLAELIDHPDSEEARSALRTADPARFPAPLPAFAPRPGFTLEPGDDPRL